VRAGKGSQADYVVVGAGSAGSVIAARLSENPGIQVILLEAGGTNRHPYVRVPLAVANLLGNPRFDWRFSTVPQRALGGRCIDYPRGRGLGGSSAVNAMAFVRGRPADYDAWAAEGCAGWNWDSVLPCFKRMEEFMGEGFERGRSGPIRVARTSYWHPISSMMIQASIEAGLPASDDYNTAHPAGLSPTQLNIRQGRRCSAADGYLAPVLKRANLRVITDARVARVLFDRGRAIGVEFRVGADTFVAHSRREVIVSAGAIGSPILLEHSGVGEGRRLRALNVPVICDRPAVGENLQDHMTVWVRARVTGADSLNRETRSLRLMGHLLRYALFRQGLFATTPTQITGFARVSAGTGPSEIELHGLPMTYSYQVAEDGKGSVSVDRQSGLSLAAFQCRPESRGSVHAVSDDVAAPPAIDLNFMDAETDRRIVLEALRLCRRMFQQPAMTKIGVEELSPGNGVESDEAMLAYVRATSHSAYHPVGTCRMGTDDEAVVDPQLRVRGVTGMRVADASIMPRIISGNTNAASIMIGERASDIILER
jgi:choline dehydrogenase